MSFSPDGRFVWFPNQQANAVTRIETTTWTVDRVLRHPAFVEPHGVILTPDGGTLFVTSHGESAAGDGDGGHEAMRARSNGTVVTIDAVTAEIRSVTEVGPYAAAPGLAVRR